MNADQSWRVKMRHYPFHIGDFRSATPHLSDSEELAYRRLLDELYDLGGLLPLDLPRVARKLRVEIDVLRVVVSEFLTESPDGYTSKRCDEEVMRYAKLIESKASAGKASAKLRSKKATDAQHVLNTCLTPVQRMLNDCSTDEEQNVNRASTDGQQTGNEIQLTKNQEPRTISPELVSSGSAEGAADAAPTPKAKRASALSQNFLPTQQHEELARKLGVNLASEFLKFKDFHTSKRSLFVDWDAALRTWLRKAEDFQGGKGRHVNSTASGRQAMTYATEADFLTPKDERGLPLSLGLSGPVEPAENANSEPFDY